MTMERDSFINDLENYLMEEEAKELELVVTGDIEQDAPIINSPQKANYFLKLVKSIDEDINSLNALCDEEINKTAERVNRYREMQMTPLVNHKDHLLKMLKNYTEHMLIDSKKRSIKLPNGTLSMSKQQPVWDYTDEDIIEFLKANNIPLYSTEIKEKLDKTAFKKAVEITKNGEVVMNGNTVPGVTVTPREDKFTVK